MSIVGCITGLRDCGGVLSVGGCCNGITLLSTSIGRGVSLSGNSPGLGAGRLGLRRHALLVREVEVHVVGVLLPFVGVPSRAALLYHLVLALGRRRRRHVEVDVAAAVAALTLLLRELQEGPGIE